MYFIYNYLFSVALFFATPFFLFRMATTRRFRKGMAERWGFYGDIKKQLTADHSIWIQAASVGEVTAALPVIDLLRRNYPGEKIILTCQTAAGRDVAREKLGVDVAVILSPLDLGFVIKNLIRLSGPQILILIETEIWPGMIMTARRNRIPVVIINGRISASSFRGYRRVISLVRPLLKMVTAFGMRSEEDASRIRELGAPHDRVTMTGNIKFDSLPGPELSPGEREELEALLSLNPKDMLIVGGSTFEGEDRILYEAYRELIPRFPGLRLLLAPRHLERVGDIEAFFHSRRQAYSLYTSISAHSGVKKKSEVVILDAMGVLSSFYGLATVAFIGRSLRGYGGQNPIEPASFRCPIIFGPHMENFRNIADDLVKAGGAVIIQDEIELSKKLSGLLADPVRRDRMGDRARQMVENRRGASQRNLELIKQVLSGIMKTIYPII
jgi:3-deoxy-D-manno-octulosonic-acid transferase